MPWSCGPFCFPTARGARIMTRGVRATGRKESGTFTFRSYCQRRLRLYTFVFQEAASAATLVPSSAHFVASDAPTNAEKRLAVGE
jgi:hypothetical protein